MIKDWRVRVVSAWVGHVILRHFSGLGIQFADVALEIRGEPDVSFAVGHQPVRTRFWCLKGKLFELTVRGSSRPSLLAICSVTQSEPSGARAGSCGRAFGVGTSHSLIETLALSAAHSAVMAIRSRKQGPSLRCMMV